MAIYLAGTEADVVTPSNGWSAVTGFDSNYSRVAAIARATSTISMDVDSDINAASATGWWLKWRYYNSYGEDLSYYDGWLVRVKNSAASTAVYISVTNGQYYVTLYSSTGNTGSTATGVYVPYAGQAAEIALHCYTSGGSAYIDIYHDSVLVYQDSVSGNNLGFASAQLSSSYNNTSNPCYGSEFIVADEDVRGMRVKTLPPTGTGTETDFTGTYADVDEYNLDTNAISSTTSGDLETFTHDGGLSTGASVRAFVLGMAAAIDSGNDIDGVVRIGSTNYVANLEQSATTGYKKNAVIWDTNPATSGAWTGSVINSMEFGVKNAS